jgi:Ion channel
MVADDSLQQKPAATAAATDAATTATTGTEPVTSLRNNAVMMMNSRGVSFRQADLDRKDCNNIHHQTTTTNGGRSNNNNNNYNDDSNSSSNNKDTTTNSMATSVTASARNALPNQNSPYNHIDLRTGMRTTRRQSVAVISITSSSSTDHHDSHCHKTKTAVHSRKGGSKQKLVQSENSDDENDHDSRSHHHHHYRITSHAAKGVYINNAVNAQKTHVVSNYLRWTFKASFFAVTMASFVQFMIVIIIFALFIYWVDFYQPQCLVTGQEIDVNTHHPNFMDAYHLSWTTLATVGYGAIYPGLPSSANGTNCYGISSLMAFEAFVGVLFCGFISAIMFSKVARVQSIAPITFSDPMLVRYGTGVMLSNTNTQDEEEEEDDHDAMSNDDISLNDKKKIDLPCPILEFRIVNDLWNNEGGEIINAGINMVASTDGAHKEFDNMDTNNCTGMYGINDNLMALGKAVASVGTMTGQAIGHVGNMTGQAIGHVGTKTGQAIGKTGQSIAQVGSITGQAIGKTGQVIGSKTSMAVKSVRLGSGTSISGKTMTSPLASLTSAATDATSPSSFLRNGAGGGGGSSSGFFAATSPPSLFRNGTAGSGGTLLQKVHNTFTKSSPADAHPGFAAAERVSSGGMDPYNQKQVTEEQINQEVERRLVQLASTGRLGDVLTGSTIVYNNNNSTRRSGIMRHSMAVEEGDAKLVPPRMYHKLDIETDTHPFFKRVWIVRHVLDETSPLVSHEARCRIKENNGYWPEEFNNWQSIREHVNFLEIIVSLSGTMNVSGSTVYGLKVYDYVDMNVGYTFATLFTKDAHGKMIVDKVLLNDVRAQAGGGEEPLQAQKDDKHELLVMAEKTYAVTAQVATTAADKTSEIVQVAAEKTVDLTKGAVDTGNDIVQKTTDYCVGNISNRNVFGKNSDGKTTTATAMP